MCYETIGPLATTDQQLSLDIARNCTEGGGYGGGNYGGGGGGYGGGYGGGRGAGGQTCYSCGGYGHMSRDCTQGQKCYNCIDTCLSRSDFLG